MKHTLETNGRGGLPIPADAEELTPSNAKSTPKTSNIPAPVQ